MIERMRDEDYFKLPAVSNSLLSRLAKCPAAINIQLEQSSAMLLGSLAHALILEGTDVFYDRYAVGPECDKRTKEGKMMWHNFCEENQGKIVITQDQLDAVVGMATSVASHPACQELLKDGEPEMAITWEEDGQPCKSKADWLSSSCLLDLKTCSDSSYSLFSKTIFNNRYAQQFGFYRRGLHANGVFPERHIIIAVESKAPFTCNVYELSDDVLDFGEGLALDLLKKYAQIKDMEVLPSYTYAGIAEIRLPSWLKEME